MGLRENFAGNLKVYRKLCGLTQEQLAELCNTDTSYIGQLETLKSFPSLSFIEKIAEVLQIEPHLLLLPQKETEIKQIEIPNVKIKTQLTKMEKEIRNLLETCGNLKNQIY